MTNLAKMIEYERRRLRGAEEAIRLEAEYLEQHKAKALPWIIEAQRIMALPDGPEKSKSAHAHATAYRDEFLTTTFAEDLRHRWKFSKFSHWLQGYGTATLNAIVQGVQETEGKEAAAQYVADIVAERKSWWPAYVPEDWMTHYLTQNL